MHVKYITDSGGLRTEMSVRQRNFFLIADESAGEYPPVVRDSFAEKCTCAHVHKERLERREV